MTTNYRKVSCTSVTQYCESSVNPLTCCVHKCFRTSICGRVAGDHGYSCQHSLQICRHSVLTACALGLPMALV
eukprot:1779262-Amphidinium_carterae.2